MSLALDVNPEDSNSGLYIRVASFYTHYVISAASEKATSDNGYL